MGTAPLAPGNQRLAGPHGDRAVIAVRAKIRPTETIPAVEMQRFDNAWPRGPPSSTLMAGPMQREVMVRSRNTVGAERFVRTRAREGRTPSDSSPLAERDSAINLAVG